MRIVKRNLFLSALNSLYRNYFQVRRSNFGYIHKTARVRFPILIKGIKNVFLEENTHILGRSLIITTKGRFIMKRNAASAEGLTVVTGNHPSVVGEFFLLKAAMDVQESVSDVVVEEDVWLASNVTLLPGVVVGRGAIVGSGSVCRKSVPPYSIVLGNPAKVVGFRFNPEEVRQHEEKLYRPEDRLDTDLVRNNYEKYYLKRIKEIRGYLK